MLYPNPVTDKLSINFSLAESYRLSFDLVSVQGAVIPVGTGQNVSAGENSFSTNIENLPAGIYLLRATGEKYRFPQKIIVRH